MAASEPAAMVETRHIAAKFTQAVPAMATLLTMRPSDSVLVQHDIDPMQPRHCVTHCNGALVRHEGHRGKLDVALKSRDFLAALQGPQSHSPVLGCRNDVPLIEHDDRIEPTVVSRKAAQLGACLDIPEP